MTYIDQIDQPTLLIDENVTRSNILRMHDRARVRGVDFRPHFKTHQSAWIGEWFREVGVKKITVSSVDMAEYFAYHGWQDILIAFSMNPRQVERINNLAERIHLELLVENHEALHALSKNGHSSLSVWIKVDVGNHRTGMNWQDQAGLMSLCAEVQKNPRLRLVGLLTHSGHTYHADGAKDVICIFREGVDRLNQLKNKLEEQIFTGLKISVGDTPGCSLCDDWSGIDEIRPGNFVFFDAMQALAGVCEFSDVSVALACPVVAKHAERSEIVIYGGAIHLSKELVVVDGKNSYGLPALQSGERWGEPIPGARVDRLSQEHGILTVPSEAFQHIEVGDLVFILPAHSCLTVQVMREYRTLLGEKIPTLNQG